MSTKSILLIHDDPALAESLRRTTDLSVLSARDASRLRQKYRHQAFSLIILEKRKNCIKDVRRLLENGRLQDDCCMIVASAGMLRQPPDRIREIISHLVGKTQSHPPVPTVRAAAASAPLAEFMEAKLPEFVRQMKTSGGRNLHSLLLREIEPPLIRLALRETNGNQIQAAHLLGMNRNTLRKKIREFKIAIRAHPAKARRRNSA